MGIVIMMKFILSGYKYDILFNFLLNSFKKVFIIFIIRKDIYYFVVL